MFRNKKFEIGSLINSIIQIKVFSGAEIELDDAKVIRKEVLEVAKGNKYAIFLDASETFEITGEARKLISEIENASQRIAIAFYIKSLPNKLAGNFFIKINRPISPTKLFSSKESALAWLKEEVEKVIKNV